MAKISKIPKIEKKKRKAPEPKKIVPTEYELKLVNDGLQEYYTHNSDFLKDGETIESKISEVIERCSIGWSFCPRTFIKRVENSTKWNTNSLKTRFDYSPSYYNAKQLQMQDDINKNSKNLYPGMSAAELRKLLGPEERKFWAERENKYRTDYELNDSSDWSLLLQVLLEELTHKRLVQRRMVDPRENLDDALDASGKRLLMAQKALGITREQRESASNETEGNIAQLVVKYEEKVKIIAKKEAKDRAEEESNMNNRRPQRIMSKLPNEMAEAIISAEAQEDRDLFVDLRGEELE